MWLQKTISDHSASSCVTLEKKNVYFCRYEGEKMSTLLVSRIFAFSRTWVNIISNKISIDPYENRKVNK